MYATHTTHSATLVRDAYRGGVLYKFEHKIYRDRPLAPSFIEFCSTRFDCERNTALVIDSYQFYRFETYLTVSQTRITDGHRCVSNERRTCVVIVLSRPIIVYRKFKRVFNFTPFTSHNSKRFRRKLRPVKLRFHYISIYRSNA